MQLGACGNHLFPYHPRESVSLIPYFPGPLGDVPAIFPARAVCCGPGFQWGQSGGNYSLSLRQEQSNTTVRRSSQNGTRSALTSKTLHLINGKSMSQSAIGTDAASCIGPRLVYNSVYYQSGGNTNGKDLYANGTGSKGRGPWCQSVEAHRRLQEDPHALLLEVRDAGNIPFDEKTPDMVNISLGTLPIRADLEVPEERREPRLQDRSRQVVTTCGLGNLAAMGASYSKRWDSPTWLIWRAGCRLGRTLACPRTKKLSQQVIRQALSEYSIPGWMYCGPLG